MNQPIGLSAQNRSVFSFPPEYDHPFGYKSILVEDLLEYIANRLSHSKELLAEGVPCELLQPGAEGWQKGTIKIALEFFPEDQNIQSDSAEIQVSETVKNDSFDLSESSPLDALRVQ